MAAGYACMADGEPHGARWLLTSLDPPATFTSCDQDFPLMMIPVLAANLDTDADKLYDVIKRHLDREAAKEAKAAKAADVVHPPTEPGPPPPSGSTDGNGADPPGTPPTSSDTSMSTSDPVTA